MSQYRLKVSLVIQEMECFDRGGMKVDSPVEGGYEREAQYNSLRVDENMDLGSRDFMGVCTVLAELHNAMKSIGQPNTPVHTAEPMSPRGVPYKNCKCDPPSPDFPYHVEEVAYRVASPQRGMSVGQIHVGGTEGRL